MTGVEFAAFMTGAGFAAITLWQAMAFERVTFLAVAWVALLAMAAGEGAAAIVRALQ